MRESEISYLAGLFDGEGSIYYKKGIENKKKHKGKGYRQSQSWRINMEITMTDPMVIHWVHQLVKCGTVTKKPRKGLRKDGTKYLIKALWVNFQRQHEFNPPHDHSDELSFVTYLKIPKEIKEEYNNYKGKSSGPGGISFIYGEGNRQAITYQAHFPEEKDLFIFPAWLKHYVAPFQSNVERVSVSGNITSNIEIKNLQPTEPKNEKK